MTAIQFLAEWALRSSILILSGALLLWAVRVKDASIRLAAWTAMLCGSLVIPAITVGLPSVPFKVMRVTARPAEIPVVIDETTPAPESEVSRHAHGIANPTKAFDWARAAAMIYALIAGGLLLRLCAGLAISRRLLRSSCATGQATEGIEIRESGVASPVALGIARAVILLPVDWRLWDRAKLDAVLAHERSHVRRHDPAVQLVSAIHRALLWHSPLSWLLHQRIVRVAEEVSDDAAVAAIRDRASYAEVLLEFMQGAVRNAGWQGVPMARYGAPAERINRILDGTALSRGVTRWSVALILALGAPLAYLVAAAQAAPIQVTTPQQAAATMPLTFDVASVKPATAPAGVTVNGTSMTTRKGSGIAIPRNTGGPGTDDPGRIHYPLISLKALLGRAWDSYFEIKSPDWLDSDLVQVEGTMPPDTTKEQFREMLRNLIADRFKLKYHIETKEVTGYALVVAKNGPKMKESVVTASPPEDDGAPRPRQIGPEGFPIPPRRAGPMLMFQSELGERARLVAQQQTMQDLARELGMVLRTTAREATGLKAKYDFTLTFAGGFGRGGPVYASPPRSEPPSGGTAPVVSVPDAAEPLPDIFSALQSQLGLKLEPKKVAVEVFVVDHMEKTPSGN